MFVSEYKAPSHWRVVKEINLNRLVSGGTGDVTVEKLFTNIK